MKFKTVEEVAAAITVRNYLNMVLDNAGIKLPEGREESRRIKNLPGQIDQMIVASVVDVFSEKSDPAGGGDGVFKVDTSKMKEAIKKQYVTTSDETEEKMMTSTPYLEEDKPKKGSFKRAK